MSDCHDADQQISKLENDIALLKRGLAQSDRLRKAGKRYAPSEASQRVILPDVNGRDLELDPADTRQAWQEVPSRMDSPEVVDAVARGVGQMARPAGADGQFVNYAQFIKRVDIRDKEAYARFTELLHLNWKELSPEDHAFVTEVMHSGKAAEMVHGMFNDKTIPIDNIRVMMANDAARFSSILESLTRLRFLADRTKQGFIDTVEEIADFMAELPGGQVPDKLKGESFRMYELALALERHASFAKRRVGQALRSLQDDIGDTWLLLDMEGEQAVETALTMKPTDVGGDSIIGKVMAVVDDGPAGQQALRDLIDAARTESIDPTARLDVDWQSVQLRVGNAMVKDSQLGNLNTQLKANAAPNAVMALYGPLQTAMENGLIQVPAGTRMTRELFMDNLKLHAEAVQYAVDAIRSAGVGHILKDAFWEGRAHYGGSADTYGKHLRGDAKTLQDMQLTMDRPYIGRTPLAVLQPGNWAIFRDKLQTAARILALTKNAEQFGGRWETALGAMSGKTDTKIPNVGQWRLPAQPALRALGAVDEVAGMYQYMFRLKAQLEVKARMEGAQLGLLTERDRAEWVQARIDEAIYQATPSEANVKAFRKQHGLRGSDLTDDEISAEIARQNLIGAPTMATEESVDAFDFSAWARMQSKPEGIAGYIDQGVMRMRQHPAIDGVMPYWRSPYNALLFDMRLAGPGLILDTARLIDPAKQTPEAIARVKAGWIMSGSLLMAFTWLDANGLISGSTDPDPSRRNRIAGVSYLGGIPVLNTLFLWKDIVDGVKAAGESQFDGDETMAAIMQVLTGQVLRQTGLSQLQQLAEAMTSSRDPGQSAQRFLGFLGSGQLPFIGPERNLERAVGADAASFYQTASRTPGERYLLGQDDPLAKVERRLRELAYNTLPGLAAFTGTPRKEKDWLGSPIGHVWGIDLAKGFPFFPAVWPKDPVYAELDAHGMLEPPKPLKTRTLDGVGMTDELQHLYNEHYGSVKGDNLTARMEMAGAKVEVSFPYPIDVVLPSGERLRQTEKAAIPLAPFLDRHVKGKTFIQAMRSLMQDPIYQAMEEDPLMSSRPDVRDQPKVLRRTKPASLMIAGLKTYYDFVSRDALERDAANGVPAAKEWSNARSRMTDATRAETEAALTSGRTGSFLDVLGQSVRGAAQ